MEITCLQMDVLISFYIDGDLSESLKAKVEEHLKNCSVCRTKLNIISSLFSDLKKTDDKQEDVYSTIPHSSHQYQFFKNNLSAYVDNELPEEDSIKMKKYTITNKNARKDLEDVYKIRKLMRDSYKKSKMESKPDFLKSVIKQIDADINELKFNPLIIISSAFLISVLIISAIVVYILSLD